MIDLDQIYWPLLIAAVTKTMSVIRFHGQKKSWAYKNNFCFFCLFLIVTCELWLDFPTSQKTTRFLLEPITLRMRVTECQETLFFVYKHDPFHDQNKQSLKKYSKLYHQFSMLHDMYDTINYKKLQLTIDEWKKQLGNRRMKNYTFYWKTKFLTQNHAEIFPSVW